MSEDKTKTLAMDEIKTPSTQPMLDVILERLNNLYHQNEASQLLIEELRSDVKSRFEVLETQLNELREETKKGFRNIENNLVVIARDILQIKANQFDLNSRLDDREHQPS